MKYGDDRIREVARTVGAVLNARGEGQIAFTRADSTWQVLSSQRRQAVLTLKVRN